MLSKRKLEFFPPEKNFAANWFSKACTAIYKKALEKKFPTKRLHVFP
jgi:hypothetical protein